MFKIALILIIGAAGALEAPGARLLSLKKVADSKETQNLSLARLSVRELQITENKVSEFSFIVPKELAGQFSIETSEIQATAKEVLKVALDDTLLEKMKEALNRPGAELVSIRNFPRKSKTETPSYYLYKIQTKTEVRGVFEGAETEWDLTIVATKSSDKDSQDWSFTYLKTEMESIIIEPEELGRAIFKATGMSPSKADLENAVANLYWKFDMGGPISQDRPIHGMFSKSKVVDATPSLKEDKTNQKKSEAVSKTSQKSKGLLSFFKFNI